MPARGYKARQIRGGHRGRAIVRQRVVIERVVIEHCAIEHRGNAAGNVVDEGKRRDTAGAYPEELVKIVSAADGEARPPQPRRELFQVDAALFEHDREPEPALLVLEEEALAMPSRQAAAQGCRLGHGEDRRMRIGPMRDPERIETGQKLSRGQRPHHDRRTMRAPGRQCKPCKPRLHKDLQRLTRVWYVRRPSFSTGHALKRKPTMEREQKLRELAAWYSDFAEKAGNPWLWEARLRRVEA